MSGKMTKKHTLAVNKLQGVIDGDEWAKRAYDGPGLAQNIKTALRLYSI
jgi:hypothetical protein